MPFTDMLLWIYSNTFHALITKTLYLGLAFYFDPQIIYFVFT